MLKFPHLKDAARKIRLNCLKMQHIAYQGHLGGAFSVTEILVALYYCGIINISPKNFNDPKRDRIIFSKGHACLSLYAVLADKGFFPKAELERYGQNGTFLGGHPDHLIPGVEVSSGSLGHGLGIGAGMAIAAKLNDQKYLTYVILGDGECTEGSIWEAIAFAVVQNLNNLIAIVDNNQIAATSKTQKFVGSSLLENKWKSFGWDTLSIDGNNISEIINALKKSKMHSTSKKPLAIIANTIKGKGVFFMEGDPKWHHGVANDTQYEQARKELSK
ncbi:MAG: TrkA [Microgenomates group bacterium Gr01-1014_7]|nr:MAG: TrkA [Microgenomates group bacterium Gr01-1014_7]